MRRMNAGALRAPAVIAIALVLAFALVVTWIGSQRRVGNYVKETDFYHLYAPDADRLLAGSAPRHTNNTGPVYPLILALLYPVTGDHFASGKAVSILAALVTALTAFKLFRGLFGAAIGLLGLVFVLTGTDFVRFAVQATTDMLFLAVAVPAVLVASSRAGTLGRRAVLAGALSGLAYLVRYAGVFLGPACLFALARRETGDRAARLRAVGLFVAGALLVISPWLIASERIHGTPFYHRTYLMMAIAAYGLPRDLDGLYDAGARFGSVAEVVGREPVAFAAQYVRNLVTTLANSLGAPLAVLPLGILAVLGALNIVMRPEAARARPLVFSVVMYLLMLGLVQWESRYFLFGYLAYGGLAAYAIGLVAGGAWRRDRLEAGRSRWSTGLAVALILAVLVPALVRAPLRIAELLRQQPLGLLDAAEALRQTRRRVPPHVMGRKPHLAYLVGGEWIFLPKAASLETLPAILCRESVDYLVLDDAAQKLRPTLAALRDPRAAPPWLRPVHVDSEEPLIVYAVALDDACRDDAQRPGGPSDERTSEGAASPGTPRSRRAAAPGRRSCRTR
jgi:4-amino-4-deoxy-L-arabinose transferase-like glycosyltransferase